MQSLHEFCLEDEILDLEDSEIIMLGGVMVLLLACTSIHSVLFLDLTSW